MLYPLSQEDIFSDFIGVCELPLSKSDTLLKVPLVFPEIVMAENGGDCASTVVQNKTAAIIMKA